MVWEAAWLNAQYKSFETGLSWPNSRAELRNAIDIYSRKLSINPEWPGQWVTLEYLLGDPKHSRITTHFLSHSIYLAFSLPLIDVEFSSEKCSKWKCHVTYLISIKCCHPKSLRLLKGKVSYVKPFNMQKGMDRSFNYVFQNHISSGDSSLIMVDCTGEFWNKSISALTILYIIYRFFARRKKIKAYSNNEEKKRRNFKIKTLSLSKKYSFLIQTDNLLRYYGVFSPRGKIYWYVPYG